MKSITYMNIKELNGYSIDKETVCIEVSGPDAENFLQGQLSNDIMAIKDDSYQFSSYSTNQGKVISLLRIIKIKNSFLLLLTADISEYFVSKLSMYILNILSANPIKRNKNRASHLFRHTMLWKQHNRCYLMLTCKHLKICKGKNIKDLIRHKKDKKPFQVE